MPRYGSVEEIPVIPWASFMETWKWFQGEHLIAIGPTGQGKSTLIEAIMPKRNIAWVLVTKKRDPIIKEFKKQGFEVRTSVRGISEQVTPKVLLQPKFAKEEPIERHQKDEFRYALKRAFEYGGVCVDIEEVQYMVEDLGLKQDLKRLWHQGRSMGVTVVAGTQRPAFIPVVAYSGSTHIFFFRSSDEYDLQRMGGLGGTNNRLIRDAVSVLKSHQVLYLNTRTGEMVITKVKI